MKRTEQAVILFLAVTLAGGQTAIAESPAQKLDRALSTPDFIRDDAHDEFATGGAVRFILPVKCVDQKEIDEIVAVLKAPVNVQYGKSGDTWERLLSKHDTAITSVRGGADSGKPLGCYVGLFDIHYQSKYKDVSLENVAFWAYDLHRFLVQNRGWYQRLNDSRYISYQDKEKFARQWWQTLDKTFASQPAAAQAAWLHDAIMDGMTVYWFCETTYQRMVPQRQKDWLGWEIRGIERRD